ncbi:ABC-2 family transporter protein [Bacillus sp. FJAT-27251]|uniref:ABC transporter permease n=1 Tax=Bacillus sp. FJAT-27251 TaxID=1684142 RepID=UPI0006A7DB73|nr:ABC-2 family transporter protein [Bacillus sp. FJAT-27251]
MNKYWQIAKVRMQEDTAYSAWYWAGTVSSILRLLIIYYFWQAVYSNRSAIQDIDLGTMITYIVVAMLLQGFVGGVGQDLAENIKNGNVAIELMRPYDLIYKMFAVDLGSKLMHLIRGTIPMMLIAFFFMDITFPGSLEAWLLFIISAGLGLWIETFFDFLVGVLAFWTVNIWGVRVLKESLVTFFSGALVPISLFPDWLRVITEFLPFQAMVYLPVSIYSGMISGTEAYLAVGLQLFWLISFYVLVRVIWAQAVKQITIFGG